MIDRFAKLPSSLSERARVVRIGRSGQVPALLIHPNWIDCVPTVIWMHGRTAYKEIDAGRFVRWVKAGFAAVSIDLPGHGARRDHRESDPRATADILAQVLPEIDEVVESLADPVWQNAFDLDRMGLGGMSLGGMATLRRLCDPHHFLCASVESTTGDLIGLYAESGPHPWGTTYPSSIVAPFDAQTHLDGFQPLPLLALHSESDVIVPAELQRRFLARLGDHYESRGAARDLIQFRTWPTTGAPHEHSGFGRVSNEAKNLQTEFFVKHLRVPPGRSSSEAVVAT